MDSNPTLYSNMSPNYFNTDGINKKWTSILGRVKRVDQISKNLKKGNSHTSEDRSKAS